MLYISGTRQKIKNFKQHKKKKDNVFSFHFCHKESKTKQGKTTFFGTGMSPGNVGSTTRYHITRGGKKANNAH